MNIYRRLRSVAHPYKVAWMRRRDEAAAARAEAARVKLTGTWLDVGAHLAEQTIEEAKRNPELTIYAFEPSLPTALHLIRIAPPNVHVMPFAVSETDGPVTLHLNANDATHSLLPLSPDGWSVGERLAPSGQVPVMSIRLDTFLREAKINHVGFLKIDAQGMDLAVLRSAGTSLSRVDQIQVEVCVASQSQYLGEAPKDEIVIYLGERGFVVTSTVVHADGNLEDLTFSKRL